ncbi:MAG: tetratricopeptide repeat protein [Candidatus Lokiarchaeota archaeon]|nr:tetratricopeptide repeat protein [Candidatus Lokiarchaeota archaeon]
MQVKEDISLTREEIDQLIKKKLILLNEIDRNQGKGSEYIRILSEIALLKLEIEEFEESENYFKTCLAFFEKQSDNLGKAAVLGLLGALFYKKDQFEESINYYRQGDLLYKELLQFKEQTTCLIGIGSAYLKLNKLDEASDIFFKCSAICADNHDVYGLLECLQNLIFIYEKEEKWDVVFELYKKTLKAFKELKDRQGMIVSYFNLGILKKKKNYEEALIYFKKGTNVAIDSNYSELIVKGLSYIAECLFYTGKIRDATNQLIKSLHLAEEIKAKNAIIQISVLLKSFGLSETDIQESLKKYREDRKITKNK